LGLLHLTTPERPPGVSLVETRQTHSPKSRMFSLAPTFHMAPTSSVVLLLEPNDDSRTEYTASLRAAGFTVVATPNCAVAHYALAEITPQIVIASFDPRTHVECLAFCERLKSDARTRVIPILLTSATINDDDLQRATEMSVLGLTVGPHDGAKMLAAVKGVLAVAEGRVSMSEPQRNVSRSE